MAEEASGQPFRATATALRAVPAGALVLRLLNNLKAVYLRGGSYDSRYGHVALVVAAWPAGYVVAEANYDGLGVIDTRSIAWPDPQVAGFIK